MVAKSRSKSTALFDLPNRLVQIQLEVQQKAAELGFPVVRFSSPQLGEEKEHLKEWLKRKYHGEMHWLDRTLPLREEPARYFSPLQSLIVLATPYASPQEIQRARQRPLLQDRWRPLIAAYARRRDYHKVLRRRLVKLARWLKERFQCETKISVDAQPVMEKAFGKSAGLGFLGKNTNLIQPQAGSFFFLSCLLTSLPLPSSKERVTVRCGSCTRCLKACPTEALVKSYLLDANRCIAYLTIEYKGIIPEPLRPKMGSWVFGCDICQLVCPFNRFMPPLALADLKEKELFKDLDLIALVSLTEEAFKLRFAGTPLIRAGRNAFLRNIAIALGNTQKEEAAKPLSLLTQDCSPLVQVHARWALDRLSS